MILASPCAGPGQEDNENLADSPVPVEEVVDSVVVSTEPTGIKQTKPAIYVYVENSGSMYGYVGTGDGSDFRNMVFNYLTDIKVSRLFQTMHLNFINSKVVKVPGEVDDFVKKLTPNSFKVSGGNSGTTDIVEVIKRMYPKSGEVAVLVSDCIVSPGKGKNASQYLVNQQTGLKGFLGQRKDLQNTGIVIYRMLGRFKGKYYNEVDDSQWYEGVRPYYVWVIGDVKTLKQLRSVTEPKMKTRPDEMCVISTGTPRLNYNIVQAGGRYRLSHSNKFTIEKLKKMRTKDGKRAVVKLNVDYSNLLQDSAYLTDVRNYQTSDPSFRVDNVVKMDNSHYVITLSSPVVKKCTLAVRLKNNIPGWVSRCSDEDGGFPNSKKSQTTYGLAYLIGGAYDAYTFHSHILAEMKINIK